MEIAANQPTIATRQLASPNAYRAESLQQKIIDIIVIFNDGNTLWRIVNVGTQR